MGVIDASVTDSLWGYSAAYSPNEEG